MAPSHVGAIPGATHPRYKTLFALSIEELINIRVDGATWDGVPNEGTYVVHHAAQRDERTDGSTTIQGQVVEQFISELLPLRTLGAVYGGLAKAELAIDGYQSGHVGSFADLLRYIQFFSVRLRRIEIYFGESALLMSDGRAAIVVNLRTEQRLRHESEVKRAEAGEL